MTDDKVWLLAVHPLHGIVGGLCISQPHSLPAVSPHDKQMSKFCRTIGQDWIASHLFFREEEQEIKLSDDDLISWHNAVFQKLYYALMLSIAVDDLPRIILLIEQDLYVNLYHNQLPFLHEQYIDFSFQSFVLSYLELSPEAKKQAQEFLEASSQELRKTSNRNNFMPIGEGDQNTRVIH